MKRIVAQSVVVAAVAVGFGGILSPDFNPSTAVAAEDGHKHGDGEKHKLGRQKIGDYTVSVIMIGEAEPGKEAEFDIKLIDAKSDPKVLRVWIGTEESKEKATAKKGKTTYDADVKVPSPMPKGAKVWVEIETDSGTSKGSYALEGGHKH